MALAADLGAKLDAGALIATFTTALTGKTADLQAVAVPADAKQIAGATGDASHLDTSGIGDAIERVASAATQQLGTLPVAKDVIGPLTSAAELVDHLATGDLITRLRTLTDSLGAELQGERSGGALGVLLKINDALAAAPEGGELKDLLVQLLTLAKIDLDPSKLSLGEALPALTGLVNATGGLISLATVLAEAEHLMAIMSRQLVPDRVAQLVDSLDASFGAGDSAVTSIVAAVDTTNPAAVEAARVLIAHAAEALQRLQQAIAEAMAFGEATLLHLDVDKTMAEAATASAMLRAADLGPAERVVAGVVEQVRPYVTIDLSGAPTFSVEQLMGTLEGKLAELTSGIDSFDVTRVAQPLAGAIGAVTDRIGDVATLLEGLTAQVRGALEKVRQVIAALPIDQIASAINTVLAPVIAAMAAITQLIATIEAALKTAADAAMTAIGDAETLVDGFTTEVETLFAGAKDVVDQVHIDQVVGAVADKVNAFADVIAKAQMQPYFDTAVKVIGTTANVIGAIPFTLLPDSMKDQVNAAVAPVKNTDAGAIEAQIEGLLQIGADGKFALRADVTNAIQEVQDKYDALLTTIAQYDPHTYVQQLDAKLAELAAKIQGIQPQLTLQPVQDAIAKVKSGIAGFDLAAQLAPVQKVFDDILAAIDEYSPVKLIQPLEQKLTDAKTALTDAIHLDAWLPAIDSLQASATSALARLDPAVLEPQFASALGEARSLIDLIPDTKISGAIGNVVPLLLSGSGIRVSGWSFDEVSDWIAGAAGGSALAARATNIADAVTATRDAVKGLDIAGVLARTTQGAAAIRAAVAGLPDSDGKAVLQDAVAALQPEAVTGALVSNAQRYLATLERAVATAETLRRTGFSIVNDVAARLKQVFAPVGSLGASLGDVLAHMGLRAQGKGLHGILRGLLNAVTPERLVALLSPVFASIRGRLQALLDAVVAPIRDAVSKVTSLLDLIDLKPLIDGIDAAVNEAKDQVTKLSPATLLAAPLAAFAALKQSVADFDPLKDVLDVLAALQAAIVRVLGKLKAETILASPLEIYDHIMSELKKLDITTLLNPVLDQLDALAQQVAGGLDHTVQAFEHLQAALPGGDGGGAGGAASAVPSLAIG